MILRIIAFIVLLVNSLFASCQDTVYFDKNQDYTDKNSASYFQVKYNDASNPERYIIEEFYTNGNRKQINYYTDKSQKEKVGVSKEWYLNGQLKNQLTYKNGKLNDTLFTYWENGKQKREDIYQNGEFIKGICYDLEGKKIPHFDYEVMPKYPGGESKLFNDIFNRIEMPEIVRTNFLKEKVIAKFAIDIEGYVRDIEIVKGNYPEVNNEVVRVLSSLKRWQPGLIDGEPVKVWYSVPILFEAK